MRTGGKRTASVFLLLTVLLLFLFYCNLALGTRFFSPAKLFSLLSQGRGNDPAVSILFKIRLPRALMALLLGGALAVSGFLLQTYFANPIAGPFVLGVSSGARLAVALCMMLFMAQNRALSSFALVFAAFLGSLVSLGILLAVSQRVRQMAGLLVAGIMIGYICSAATDFLLSFAAESEIVSLHSWSQGSFSGISLAQVRTAAVLICAARRERCGESRGECAAHAQRPHHSREFACGDRDRFCGAGFLCGGGFAVFDSEPTEEQQAVAGAAGFLPRGSGILFGLGFNRKDGLSADRACAQHGDLFFRRADCTLALGEAAGKMRQCHPIRDSDNTRREYVGHKLFTFERNSRRI